MANDDEYIMSSFKDFVIKRAELITYYEMDAERISEFNNRILCVERNPQPNEFPDFLGKCMDVEVFNVSSTAESKRKKGSQYHKERSALEDRMNAALKLSDDPEENKKGKSYVETLEYKNHSYEFWISSILRNIKAHKDSRNNYDPQNKECAFIAHYTQTVLSYKDENGIEQWHCLGVDRRALSLIYDELKGLIDYFILYNETNSKAEVIPIEMIPSYLNKQTLQYDFYPREGAGEIRIGCSDTIEPFRFGGLL